MSVRAEEDFHVPGRDRTSRRYGRPQVFFITASVYSLDLKRNKAGGKILPDSCQRLDRAISFKGIVLVLAVGRSKQVSARPGNFGEFELRHKGKL